MNIILYEYLRIIAFAISAMLFILLSDYARQLRLAMWAAAALLSTYMSLLVISMRYPEFDVQPIRTVAIFILLIMLTVNFFMVRKM